MSISVVVAVGKEREMGAKGKMPWHLSADLKRFRSLTINQVVIMGRKTFESIGKPLPDRLNIVLSKNPNLSLPPGVLRAATFDEALTLVPEGKEAFAIGGSKVIDEALRVADKMHITFVDVTVPDADTFFPRTVAEDWKVIQVTPVPANERNPLNSTYIVYERRK